MSLRLTHALRLRRRDLDRVHPVNVAQFVAAIAPGKPADAPDLVEDGRADEEEGETFGLVYLRFDDDGRAFEGFFLDGARTPSKTTNLEGGALFHAGTTTPAGVEMSQSCVHDPVDGTPADLHAAFVSLTRTFAVKTSGAAFTADPPFLHAKAPPKAEPVFDAGTLELELAAAERYTQGDVRAASRERKWLLLHSVRPKFATDIDDMESFFQLGVLYGMIDPGASGRVTGMPLGLVHARFRTKEPVPRSYEGFFWDWRQTEPAAFWPSRRATLVEGRLFVADTVTPTGVDLKKGKLTVDKKLGRPEAVALAAGLKKLGLDHPVSLISAAEPDAKGFFGSERHAELVK